MNKNLDLTKILEGCPKGTELYSTVYGKVRFEGISNSAVCPIEIKVLNKFTNPSVISVYITKDGRCTSTYDGECTLFPAKDQRDWSKFERFWDKPKVEKFDPNTLEPYDRVLVRDATSRCWKIDFYGCNTNPYVGLINCASGSKPYCIPYNEETKHLVGTTEEAPEFYRYWEE